MSQEALRETVDAALSTRDRRIAQHQGLARSVATTVWKSIGESAPLDDVIAYGQIGLIEAVDHYRPEMGCEFSTFAYYRIRGAALDGVCKLRGMSRRMSDRARFLRGFQDLHASRVADGALGVEARETKLSAIQDSLRDGLVLFFLSKAPGTEGAGEEESVESQASIHEMAGIVRQAIGGLPAVEAAVVRKLYFEGASLTEAADSLGISRSWACRLHQRAIDSLRRVIEQRTTAPRALGGIR